MLLQEFLGWTDDQLKAELTALSADIDAIVKESFSAIASGARPEDINALAAEMTHALSCKRFISALLSGRARGEIAR